MAGETCGPPQPALELGVPPLLVGVMICSVPSDSGTTDEGGVGEGGSAGGDTGISDAPTSG